MSAKADLPENVVWRTRLLIGSPNDTHRVNPAYLAPVQEWLVSLNLPGWTMYRTLSGWKDNPAEEGIMVDIVGNHEITFGQVDELRAKLNQSAIGATVEPITSAFIDSPTGEPKTLLIQRGKEVYKVRVEAVEAELKEVKKKLAETDYALRELAAMGEDMICLGCGAFGEYNELWPEPFKCSKCGASEYEYDDPRTEELFHKERYAHHSPKPDTPD